MISIIPDDHDEPGDRDDIDFYSLRGSFQGWR